MCLEVAPYRDESLTEVLTGFDLCLTPRVHGWVSFRLLCKLQVVAELGNDVT